MAQREIAMGTLGAPVKNWVTPLVPQHVQLQGRSVALEPLRAAQHGTDLYRAFEGHPALWDYMYDGPFDDAAAFQIWLEALEARQGFCTLVLRDLSSGLCGGIAAFMRIEPDAGSIEVGNICIGPQMQRSYAATEAMYLMMDWAFRAGYRRYEWKCNALNLPSRRAAQRLGFSYEGLFRQHTVVKGRNRDTAWFSVIDSDWPALTEAFRVWLDAANFDSAGQQHESLSDLTRLVRQSSDPALG